MPHGLPDWGLEGPKSTTYGLDDLGEQAVRLGSIVSFDRRGDVVFLDGFEDGLNRAIPVLDGLNARVGLDATYPKSGAFHVRLVGGSTLTRLASIVYARGLPNPGAFGLEVSICMPAQFGFLDMYLAIDDATTQWLCGIRYNRALGRWYYWNDVGGWTQFAAAWLPYMTWPPWHTFKVVMDTTTGVYWRVLLNNVPYTLGNALVQTPGTLGFTVLFATIDLYSRAAQNDYVYVDDVIVTQNEP